MGEVAKNDDYGWLGLASLTLTSIPSKRKKVCCCRSKCMALRSLHTSLDAHCVNVLRGLHTTASYLRVLRPA